MTARIVLALLVALVVVGCSSRRQRPPGPAPEYEPPRVTPWDAGAPVDPLDTVKGEEVTDDEPPAPLPEAGPADAAPADGG